MMTTMMQSNEQEQDNAAEEEAAWWEAVQQEIRDSNDAVSKAKLQTLQECMVRRQAALERMEGVLNQCVSIGLLQEHLGVKADDDDSNAVNDPLAKKQCRLPPPTRVSIVLSLPFTGIW